MNRRATKKRIDVRDVILILSQDTGGAFEYLRQNFDKREISPNLVISVQGAGTASRTMLADARRALTGKSHGLPESRYAMLVVDRDSDPGLRSVLDYCSNSENIEVFVSAPCIEYYFMLHFDYSRPAMKNFEELQLFLRRHEGFAKYSKVRNAVPVALLAEQSSVARKNSELCRKACDADGSKGPRSDLDLLFDAIEAGSQGGLEEIRESREIRDKKRFKPELC